MRISDWSSDVCSSDLERVSCWLNNRHTSLAHGNSFLDVVPIYPLGGWCPLDESLRDIAVQLGLMLGPQLALGGPHLQEGNAFIQRVGHWSSAERRVGTGLVRRCKFRWSPAH